MRVEVNWHDERKTAVEISINEYEPTWGPFDSVVDQALEFPKTVPHNVIIIINPHGKAMPKAGPPLPHVRRLINGSPANVLFVVAIMGNLGFFERRLGEVLMNVSFRGKLKHVTTQEEAYALIPAAKEVSAPH